MIMKDALTPSNAISKQNNNDFRGPKIYNPSRNVRRSKTLDRKCQRFNSERSIKLHSFLIFCRLVDKMKSVDGLPIKIIIHCRLCSLGCGYLGLMGHNLKM